MDIQSLIKDNRLSIPKELLEEIFFFLQDETDKLTTLTKQAGYERYAKYLKAQFDSVKKTNPETAKYWRSANGGRGIGLSGSTIERARKGSKGSQRIEVAFELLDFLCYVCKDENSLVGVLSAGVYDSNSCPYDVRIPEYAQKQISELSQPKQASPAPEPKPENPNTNKDEPIPSVAPTPEPPKTFLQGLAEYRIVIIIAFVITTATAIILVVFPPKKPNRTNVAGKVRPDSAKIRPPDSAKIPPPDTLKIDPIKTVTIRNQVWMANNLNVDTYNNGQPIAKANTKEEWKDYAEKHKGCWCYYQFDNRNESIYGKLYNWYAVSDANNKGIIPVGFSLPTVADFNELVDYWDHLKPMYSSYLARDRWGQYFVSNTSGFGAVPSGCFASDGWQCILLGQKAVWWVNDEAEHRPWTFALEPDNKSSEIASFNAGYAVRCISIRQAPQKENIKSGLYIRPIVPYVEKKNERHLVPILPTNKHEKNTRK